MNYKQRLLQADAENKRAKQIDQSFKRAEQAWKADILETSIALDNAKDKLEAARLKEPLRSSDVLAAKREVLSLETGLKELQEEYMELFEEQTSEELMPLQVTQ